MVVTCLYRDICFALDPGQRKYAKPGSLAVLPKRSCFVFANLIILQEGILRVLSETYAIKTRFEEKGYAKSLDMKEAH